MSVYGLREGTYCTHRQCYRVLHPPIMVVTHVVVPSSTHKRTRRGLAKRKTVVNGNSEVGTTKQGNTVEDEDTQLDPLNEESIQFSKNVHEDNELAIDVDPESTPQTLSVPFFPALPAAGAAHSAALKSETRRIPIPPHRMTPIKKDWINIFSPLTEILGLQVRMNVQRRSVEIRVCSRRPFNTTPDTIRRRLNTQKILGQFKKEPISSKHMR